MSMFADLGMGTATALALIPRNGTREGAARDG